jgi:hypothetical protein
MRVLLSTSGSLGAEGCDALVATRLTPAGVWR